MTWKEKKTTFGGINSNAANLMALKKVSYIAKNLILATIGVDSGNICRQFLYEQGFCYVSIVRNLRELYFETCDQQTIIISGNGDLYQWLKK